MFSFLRTGVKKDYDIEKKIIGEGKFATVRRAVHRQTGQQVAVKTIFKDRVKKNKAQNCCSELILVRYRRLILLSGGDPSK